MPLSAILVRLNVTDRTEAVVTAVHRGLIHLQRFLKHSSYAVVKGKYFPTIQLSTDAQFRGSAYDFLPSRQNVRNAN